MGYTKGPWRIQPYDENIVTRGRHIAADDGSTIAVVLGGSPGGSEECAANVKLIAAAPDLLKIAELILEEWDKPTEDVACGELIARLSQYSDLARTAVMKAKYL